MENVSGFREIIDAENVVLKWSLVMNGTRN